MSTDKRLQKYAENMPYGNDAKSSEIHGKLNEEFFNSTVTSMLQRYDQSMADGDKAAAKVWKDGIHSMAQQADNLKEMKKEWIVIKGGGIEGADNMSNWTDDSWEREFFLENGTISLNREMRLVLSVIMPNGEEVSKQVEDISENWVVKGTEEADFMKMQQDAIKQRNTIGKPLDYDIDWAVDRALRHDDGYKKYFADPIGAGGYFLWSYLQENEEALKNGEITDEMLHPESFNPESDPKGRLHTHFTNILHKSFDPNYQTPKEAQEADELMAKTNNEDTQA